MYTILCLIYNVFFVISEDIDPTVGKFRNMVQTTIIVPTKVHSFQCSYNNHNVLQECIQMIKIHDSCGDPSCREKSWKAEA